MATIDEAKASVPRRAVKVRDIYNHYASLFERFRGGMPVGVFAAIAQWESNGKMSSRGDPKLEEVGIFQITKEREKLFQVEPKGVRSNLEANFWLAGLEYNYEARRLDLRFPGLFREGSKDQWLLARLSFAIGRSATYRMINMVNPSPSRSSDGVYNQIVAYVEKHGAFSPGPSQSVSKIKYRTVTAPLLWDIGHQAGLDVTGIFPPWAPSPPSAVLSYRLPKDAPLSNFDPGYKLLLGIVGVGAILSLA